MVSEVKRKDNSKEKMVKGIKAKNNKIIIINRVYTKDEGQQERYLHGNICRYIDVRCLSYYLHLFKDVG